VPSRTRCRHVHSNDTVSFGCTFLGGFGEALEPLENFHARESGGCEDADELCFQQSAGDSTGPEVDVPKSAVWQNFANDDVGDLRAPTGLQDPRDLADGFRLVRYEVEHTIRDDDIDSRVPHRKIRRITVPDIDIREAAGLGTGHRPLTHCDSHVDADRAAVWTNPSRSKEQVHPGSASDVEHDRVALDSSDGMWISDAREGGRHAQR
jgi:hypothetical protein